MRMTFLEAINEMLHTIGEQAVTALGTGHPDAETAELILSRVNRRVQSRGWYFNKEYNIVLAQDGGGEVSVGEDVLELDECGDTVDQTLVLRGSRLYNTNGGTFVLNRAVTVNLTRLVEFEDMPEPAREYIRIRAARTFQQAVVGSSELDGFTREDEAKAWAELRAAEEANTDNTILASRGAIGTVVRTRGAAIFNAFGG